MNQTYNRRAFITNTLALTAGAGFAGAAWARPQEAKADALIFIHLSGGAAQADLFNPKGYTPFVRGMKGRELLGTCRSIATRADGVRFASGLERLASVMHKGTVVRSIRDDAACGLGHGTAQKRMRFGEALSRAIGPRNANVPGCVAIVSGARLDEALIAALGFIEMGARGVEVRLPYRPFEGFDTHEFGGRRIAELKRGIDRPIAELVENLDARGMLERTVVCIASEFGRSVDADAVIHDERDYGFHRHCAEENCALIFGGGFKGGSALDVEVSRDEFRGMIFSAMGASGTRADE